MSLLGWWAAHPWRAWWASYLPAGAGALLAQIVPMTGLIIFALGMILWFASLIQGLRVSWHRSRKRAAIILGVMFLIALSTPILKGLSTGDLAKLDSEIVAQIVGYGLVLATAIAAEYLVRGLRRLKRSSRAGHDAGSPT